MRKELFERQQDLVDRAGKKTALFWDMGLGKTITAIEIMKKYNINNFLVICPKSMIDEWIGEIYNQIGLRARFYDDFDRELDDVMVINSELVWRRDVGEFDGIIIDESHMIKNPNSKIGKYTRKLEAEVKCILTGTPQSKGFIDYYNQLYFLDMIDMSFKDFKDRYCVYKKQTDWKTGKTYMDLIGYKNVEEFESKYLSKCEFLKLKREYDSVIKYNYIKIPTTKAYNRAVADKVIYYDKNNEPVFKRKEIEKYLKREPSTINRHIMLDNSGAYRYGIRSLLDKRQWLKDFLNNYNERIVIFYNYYVELDQILDVIGDRPYSTYNLSSKDLTNFKKNSNGVAICNYASASVGINDLVLSNVFVAYSPTENYILWEQSKKRINRQGQLNTPIYYFLQSGIEYNIYEQLKTGKNFDDRAFREI